jgi:hypothetical protein
MIPLPKKHVHIWVGSAFLVVLFKCIQIFHSTAEDARNSCPGPYSPFQVTPDQLCLACFLWSLNLTFCFWLFFLCYLFQGPLELFWDIKFSVQAHFSICHWFCCAPCSSLTRIAPSLLKLVQRDITNLVSWTGKELSLIL